MAKNNPLRQCVGCGEMVEKREMIRVIRTPEGQYMLDASGRANGRGAYLCRKASCLECACKKKGLERSFKDSIPVEVYDRLKGEFLRLESE